MYYFIIFVLLWLILGFIAFLKEARDEKCVVFDKSCVDEFMFCLVFGPASLLILFFDEVMILLRERRKKKNKKNLFIRIIEMFMRLVQKKEK